MSTDDNLMMDLLNTPNFDCEAPQIPVIFNESLDDNQVVANSTIDLTEQPKPKKNVSKLFKKVQELNIPKINIPSKQAFSSFGSASSNNTVEKESPQRFSNITTDTEKMYQSFIDTQPTINFDLLDKFGTEENFEKLILGFPTPQVTKLTEVDPFLKPVELQTVKFEMDHAYTPKKQKISEDSMLDDSISMDSFASSFNSTSGTKRQRKRGIYRAEDVTNDEERRNYLERRKKNNISSKISRANKKRAYSEIDEKCSRLETDNEEMKVKIDELENLNKQIKDLLVERFTQCKSEPSG